MYSRRALCLPPLPMHCPRPQLYLELNCIFRLQGGHLTQTENMNDKMSDEKDVDSQHKLFTKVKTL